MEQQEDMAQIIRALAKQRDWSGEAAIRVTEGLIRASAPLENEWVHNFMFADNRIDVASVLAVLTAPGAMESAMLLSGTWDSFGATFQRVDSTEVVNFLLVPCVALGDSSVGLVLTRETQIPDSYPDLDRSRPDASDHSSNQAVSTGLDPCMGHLHLQGRFYFSNETGDLLILQELMPHEFDCCSEMLYTMSACLGVVVPSESPLRSREVLRMVWMPGARNHDGSACVGGKAVSEKLTINLDKAQYMAGNYTASIISARYSPNSTRMVCATCQANKSQPTTVCGCRSALFSPVSFSDHSTAARNVNLSHRGHWLGDCDMFCYLPGVVGPAMSFRQKLSINVGLTDGANELCSQLRSLAIDRSMHLMSLPKQIMPAASTESSNQSSELSEPPGFDAVDAFLSQDPIVEGHQGSAHGGDHLLCSKSFGVDPPDSIAPLGASIFGLPTGEETVPIAAVRGRDIAVKFSGSAPSNNVGFDERSFPVGAEPAPVPVPDVPSPEAVVLLQVPRENESEGCPAPTPMAKETISPEEARAIARKKRAEGRILSNREAARRSNERRRVKNLELKESLKAEKRKAVELRTLEMELRAQNVHLRMQYEMQRSGTVENGQQ